METTKRNYQPEENSKTTVKCEICHRTLTRKESIARKRGPVCASKQESARE